jgi:hypothetical protein
MGMGKRVRQTLTKAQSPFFRAAMASSSVYSCSVLWQIQASFARGRAPLEDIAVQNGCGANFGESVKGFASVHLQLEYY